MQQMWNMKCVIIAVITGTTLTVTYGLKKNLEAKSGKYSIDSLQKKNTATVLVGTSHTRIIQKVLQSET